MYQGVATAPVVPWDRGHMLEVLWYDTLLRGRILFFLIYYLVVKLTGLTGLMGRVGVSVGVLNAIKR